MIFPRDDVSNESMEWFWDGDFRKKELPRRVLASRGAVSWVNCAADVRGLNIAEAGLEEMVDSPKDEIGLLAAASPPAPTFDDSLVVAKYAE